LLFFQPYYDATLTSHLFPPSLHDALPISYLEKILRKEVFDHAGLIYGMGHAVYTESDPRAVILKEYARRLSESRHGDQTPYIPQDRKSTRLNSSHVSSSYAVFCLKRKEWI